MGLPRILVIDDLFGRSVANGPNRERANLCAQFLLRDVTDDEQGEASSLRVRQPIAEAIFCRGQQPPRAELGDVVENDLDGTIDRIRSGWDRSLPGSAPWSLVLLDLCFYTGRVTDLSHGRTTGMPEGRPGDEDPEGYFGLCLLRHIHERFPQLPVVILSSMNPDEVRRETDTHGALDFLDRSDQRSPELLRQRLWSYGLLEDEAGAMLGRSLPLLLALRSARRAASVRRNVLIRGERGTGKELLARYIHVNAQEREESPYEVVNAAALTPELFASELFGHRRGSFTGAVQDRPGRIALADGGDLFLDEIANMPPVVQAGVLRVLETREVTPVGESKSKHVDVRFLSATNRDIEAEAASGAFRADLLDRLREGGTVILPPLRNRVDDVPLLAEHFVRRAEALVAGSAEREVTPEALEKLCAHPWPGNVRELGSTLHRAVRDHPHVEYLVPGHLELDSTEPLLPNGPQSPAVMHSQDAAPDLRTLTTMICRLSPNALKPEVLRGGLRDIDEAVGALKAAALSAALRATCRYPAGFPHGQVQIHPAMKLLVDDDDLTASQAADMTKRLLKPDPALDERLAGDPLLEQAWRKAHELRPSRPQRSRGRKRQS